ncbi:MAG: ParA family protein [Gemmatimonadales bacterium]
MATRFTGSAHAAVTLPRVTAVLNQKGGVGKTGLTVGTGGALAELGRRVLLVDLDPQGHLTTEALRLDEADPDEPNLAAALVGEYTGPVEKIIVQREPHANGGRLDLIPTSVSMFLLVRKLYSGRAPETKLARLIERLNPDSYDHILIDCPPSLDILTDTALVAADGLVIPVQPNSTSLRALRLLVEQVAVIEEELQLPRRELYGLVPGVYRRPLSGIAKFKMNQLEAFGQPEDPRVAPLPILAHLPLAAVVEEAWLSGEPVTDYKPTAPICDAYRRIALRLDISAGLSDPATWDPSASTELAADAALIEGS